MFTYLESDPLISNLLSTLRHNIEYLHKIPTGSYLKFYYYQMILKIQYCILCLWGSISVNICVITHNVYDNNFNVLPKLKKLCTSAKCNRGKKIKNANNIINK
jgi:hypothetical protein